MFGLNPGAACSFNPPFFSLTVDINNEMKDELKKGKSSGMFYEFFI
jgi:hypothetical protein